MAYGINIWSNINTTNDSIVINNCGNLTKAVNSSYGSNIVVNGNLSAK